MLRLKKTFQTPTSPMADGRPIFLDETLETTLQVPASGRFEWHVNPSTRPLVARQRGRPATGNPSDPVEFSGGVTGPPIDGATACGDAHTEDATCFNDHPFTVPSGPGADNASARVRMDWATPASDWDLRVFRDSDGNGSSAGETEEVGSSRQGTTHAEETTVAEPVLQPGAKYVVRVSNFAATEPYEGAITYAGPDPVQPAQTESWTLTCESPEGTLRLQRTITIGRGERQRPDLRTCAPAPTLSVANARVTEGDSGTRNANFRVSLSAASWRSVSVRFATANGTARAPGDYAAKTGTVTFTPGQRTKSVAVRVKGDRLRETNETFLLKLWRPTNAGIRISRGRGTIRNDD